ncbi:putative polysaccharide biosynthesis protein [Paenibacillus daejeonensis]|uniref:putative polysaccharide biosynthesis protein n=1 Tax=Paenibacillus daejeonensis TaxID=135193 RepID=UPI00036751E5|nr:polysaccharide biosynthesis protein [Paenibacillus daejeonensis]
MSRINDEGTERPRHPASPAIKRKDRAGSWLRGAVWLGAAALISKVIGTLQKIPLQNLAGDRVFGIYNAVYPFYQLLLFLATAGIPVAVSLLVAERRESGDDEGMHRVLRTAVALLGLCGAIGFAVMWASAGTVAGWIGDDEAAAAIRMASLALWFVPAMAALRGYFQGMERMQPSAFSQVIEQSVRVVVMLLLLYAGLTWGWSDRGLASGALAGSAAGGAAGLVTMLVFWWQAERRGRGHVKRKVGVAKGDLAEAAGRSTAAGLPVIRRLVALAVPVALGSIALPIFGIVDAFTVPRLLQQGGLEAAQAMERFGQYSRAQPLVQLVVMVAGAGAGALVPALAAARARGDLVQARLQAGLALRLAWYIGLPAALGLMLLAEPINVMLYADNAQTDIFALVGSTAAAGTLGAVTAAVLQGFGSVRGPAVFLLAAALLKVALSLALVPAYGLAGAAWSGIAALALPALLGLAAVRRAGGPGRGLGRPAWRHAAAAGLALACMAAALWLLGRGFAALPGWGGPQPSRMLAAVFALTGVAVGAAVYGAALLRGGAFGADELRALPGGTKLAAKLRRWRLLPRRTSETTYSAD